MKIWTLWEGDEEGMPWLVDSYDEYSIDGGAELPQLRVGQIVIWINVPDKEILDAFQEPSISGSVVTEEP